MKVTFIGDIHRNYKRYKQILYKNRNNYTIQVGDFGFSETWSKLKNDTRVSSMQHKVLGGNHDDYDYILSHQIPHYLGDYGMYQLGPFQFFFLRGAYSIDKARRTIGIDWWEEEELTYTKCEMALKEYELAKPNIVITHTCPDVIFEQLFIGKVLNPSLTGTVLNNMFAIHQPKLWIFGHMHKSVRKNLLGTEFICLNEYETFIYDIE